MSYGDLQHYREKSEYWHKQYREANHRANAAVAEAKKSKERELTAIRMLLEHKKRPDEAKKHKDMLDRIGVEWRNQLSEITFAEAVYEILEELNDD